jgi:hypothetical protein
VIRIDASGHAWWSGIASAVHHWASHAWNTVRASVSGAVGWVAGVVASWHLTVAAMVSQFRAAVRRAIAWAPMRRSARMTAHPQRRPIQKWPSCHGPQARSGIRFPHHRTHVRRLRYPTRSHDQISWPSPRFEPGPLITTFVDFLSGLSNIQNSRNHLTSSPQQMLPSYRPRTSHQVGGFARCRPISSIQRGTGSWRNR